LVNVIGIIGAFLLAICGIPQAVLSIKSKHSSGVSLGFLLMWGIGEILVFLYVIMTSMDLILLINYFFNIILVAIILYYKKND